MKRLATLSRQQEREEYMSIIQMNKSGQHLGREMAAHRKNVSPVLIRTNNSLSIVSAAAIAATIPRAIAFAVSVTAAALSLRSLVAKNIQTVHKVEHTVAVDRVILRVLTHGGRNGTTDIALIAQNIKELYAHRSGIVLQEILRYLGVPYQFVSIHIAV